MTAVKYLHWECLYKKKVKIYTCSLYLTSRQCTNFSCLWNSSRFILINLMAISISFVALSLGPLILLFFYLSVHQEQNWTDVRKLHCICFVILVIWCHQSPTTAPGNQVTHQSVRCNIIIATEISSRLGEVLCSWKTQLCVHYVYLLLQEYLVGAAGIQQ